MRKGQRTVQIVKNEPMQGVGQAMFDSALGKVIVPYFTMLRFQRNKTFNVFFFIQEKQFLISNPNQLEVIYE